MSADIISLWSRIFGNKPVMPLATACAPQPAKSEQSPRSLPTPDSPSHSSLALQGQFTMLWEARAAPSSSETSQADTPEWFAVLQAHVAAVRANDTAVRLFREGQLDDAIAELRCGLSVNPHYATGYSNLGFLYVRKGQLELAVECLLRALELEPQHNDAADHLFDVLRAFIDELVLIALTEGFLSAQPEAEAFDEYNRHRRTRDIGLLIAKIGQRRILTVEDSVLDHDLLLRIVVTDVQKRMDCCRNSITLPFAWQGIQGWNPPVAVPLQRSADAVGR